MAASPSIVCRRVVSQDRDQLMAIDDVYGGIDYLPHMFDRFVSSSHYRSFVCEVDGRVVSFRYFRIIDDGQSVIAGGARTHKDFRGQGLAMKRLLDYAAREILKEYPNCLRNYLYAALETPFQQKRIKENPKTFTLISKRVSQNNMLAQINE